MASASQSASSAANKTKKDVGQPTLSEDGKTKVYQVHGRKFEVDSHYDVTKVVGYGAYGTVCAAVDHKAGIKVAIKKMAGVFDDLIDGKRILREITVLTSVRHPNVVKLYTVLRPVDPAKFTDIYMVTALLDADLNHIIRSKQRLLDAHCQYFMAQLLRSVKYIHSANIVHRDIKPSNLLVNANCDLVLCDFGLARTVENNSLTGYVVTRWYRAPELLVLNNRYTFPVDIWSVGCILAELQQRRPLFQGTNYLDQLHQVIAVLGTPSEEDLADTSEEAKRYIASLERRKPVDFAVMFPNATPQAIDMLSRMLKFHPKKRITAADALAHPYLAKLHKLSEEPTSEIQHHWSMEETDFTEPTLRQAFLDVIERINTRPPPMDQPRKSNNSNSSSNPTTAATATAAASSSSPAAEAATSQENTANAAPNAGV
jgi:mitogen-activated protein kinase 6